MISVDHTSGFLCPRPPQRVSLSNTFRSFSRICHARICEKMKRSNTYWWVGHSTRNRRMVVPTIFENIGTLQIVYIMWICRLLRHGQSVANATGIVVASMVRQEKLQTIRDLFASFCQLSGSLRNLPGLINQFRTWWICHCLAACILLRTCCSWNSCNYLCIFQPRMRTP